MKAKALITFLIFSFFACTAFSQNHWAQKVWGLGADMGLGITSDNQGNIYNTGSYAGDGHFGNIIISNPQFQYECFIAKFNQEGVALWANHAGGPGTGGTQSNAVAIDDQYNVYITGYFDSIAVFDTTTLSSSGSLDIFIAKLDADGNFLWSVKAGGPGRDNASGISVDVNGNIFITGYFSDSCNFGGITLSSYGDRDLFIAKYDNSGNLLWVRSGGSNNDPAGNGRDEGTGIINDLAGNAYISGLFIDTAYFSSDTLISTGSYDALIAKYNSGGVLQWINHGGGRSGDGAFGLVADNNGRIHLAGNAYTDPPFVQFNGITLNLQGGNDIFHVTYDSSGAIISAVSDGGGSDEEANAISVDTEGNVYITGRFLDSATFSGTHYTGNGFYDAFVVMYDSAANYITSRHYGGPYYDIGYGITTDMFGNCTSTGTFDFNVQFGNTSLSSGGNFDAYLATLNDTILSPPGLVPANYHTGNSALRSNNIVDIIADANKIVYAATVDSGVYRFDGTSWASINCPANAINSLFTDSVNNLWICTVDSGLIRYDGSAFTTFNIFNSGLPTNNISSATALPGQIIWIGTNGKGCVRYDGTNYTVFDSSNSALPSNHITTMNCDSTSTYWMGTAGQGIAAFFNGSFTIYNTTNSAIPSDNINGASIDTANNQIWIATDKGLAAFDGTTWTVLDTSTGLPANELNDVIITRNIQQNMAFERKGAVVNSGTVQRSANTSNALFDNNITTIYADTSGKVIWLGTQYNGIYRLIDTSTVISTQQINAEENFKLSCYPNPAVRQVFLSCYLEKESEVTISIHDMTGRLVNYFHQDKKPPGLYKQMLSLDGLTAGIYTLTFTTASGSAATLLVKEDSR